MAIRFRLQTSDSTSFDKHVIDGVGNEHKAVVVFSKNRAKAFIYGFLIACNSFKLPQANSFLVAQEKKIDRNILQKRKLWTDLK